MTGLMIDQWGQSHLFFVNPLTIRLTEAVCLLIAHNAKNQSMGSGSLPMAHNAQGPQRKLRALLFVVLVAGLSRCLREH